MFLTMGKIRECGLFTEHYGNEKVRIFIPTNERKIEHHGKRVLGVRAETDEREGEVFVFLYEGKGDMSENKYPSTVVRLDVYQIQWEKIDYPDTK